MKPFALLVALLALLAGCVDAPPEEVEAAVAPEPEPEPLAPYAAEGVVFLPPSTGQDRVETLIPFPVNGTEATVVSKLALSAQYGPLALPVTMADVLVEIRAPDGTVLVEGALRAADPQAELAVDHLDATGEYVLALLSYGGSDESANGDNVRWTIDVAPHEMH